MAYIFVKEVVGDEKVAQVYKISGLQQWAVKQFERSHHAIGETLHSSESEAESAAYDWAKPNQSEEVKAVLKAPKKKTSTDE